MKKIFLFGFLFLLISPIFGQDIKVDAEIRPRTEYAHGVSTLALKHQNPAVLTTQRTRLNLYYKDKWFASKVVFQDVRNWGGQSQLVTNEDFATSIHQAWGEVFIIDGLGLRAGRQELAYDNHRILGNVGWAQQARSHDLALLKFEKDDYRIHAGIAHHDDGDLTSDIYLGPDSYKNMQFAWFHKDWEKLGFSFLFLNNGIPIAKAIDPGEDYDQVDKYSQTFGPYIHWIPDDWDIEGNIYFQTGEASTGQTLFAYEFLINGMYNLNENWGIGAGFELLSGTDYDETEDVNSFSPLYGTNHKFNGFMDYFYVGSDGNDSGLMDVALRGKYKKERLNFALDVHAFWTEKEIESGADKFLGTEIDLTCKYNVSKSFGVQAGYSHLFATHSMLLIKGGSYGATQNWGYAMLTFKPKFFAKNMDK